MTCSTFSSCRLYSWMRLICTSKSDVGIDVDAEHAPQDQRASRSLFVALDRAEPLAERGVVGERLEPAQLGRGRVTQPSPMASVISAASPGLPAAASARGVTPFVLLLNRSGKSSSKSRNKRLLQELGVQRAPRR